MAHVLLPCDLPSWVDVQRHLVQLKTCKNAAQMTQVMVKVYEICCISLDPDDMQPSKDHEGFRHLQQFVEEVLEEEERSKFLERTLPEMVSHALGLRVVKPRDGFLYSLKKEDESFELERSFVASLLANAFLSTFPKRNSKTHPTLQDFSFTDFFAHLENPNHQQKFKSFLRFFSTLDEKPKGRLKFTRRAVSGPSLPGWLCSNRPLVPLIVRHEGSVHDAEPQLLRACSCSASIGGDVLKKATSQESDLFFSFPELLVCLSFVECLDDNEALVAEGVQFVDSIPLKQNCRTTSESHLCLLDPLEWQDEPNRQFADVALLRELNKALSAFTHDFHGPASPGTTPKQRRHTPVGESSSSEAASSAGHHILSKREPSETSSISHKAGKSRSNSKDSNEGRSQVSKDSRGINVSTYFPPITSPQCGESPDHLQRRRSSTGSKVTSKVSLQTPPKPETPLLKKLSSSRSSSKMSLKTASQSSVESLPIQPVLEEEYYTADEDSCEGSDGQSKSERRNSKGKDKRTSIAMTDLLKEELELFSARNKNCGKRLSRDSMSEVSRDSVGYVLGGSDDESESLANQHERLDDFRKRIRKRNRRRMSRRSSRSSYSGSSSDMEDISEDPELQPPHNVFMRPTSSEPSLLTAVERDTVPSSPFRLSDEATFLFLDGNRKRMVTSSHGQPKAYSYDGVNPNLPVPFKAAFRRRRLQQGQSRSLDTEMDFLWSASMVERSSSAEDESSRSRTKDSVDVLSESGEKAKSWKRWPVAAEPRRWKNEDPQLKALVLWLAASLADLPFLILYATFEPALNELNSVYSQVLNRHWTVGDLSCEVLRFCRNKSKHRGCLGLFGQLLGKEATTKSSLTYNLSQQSLD